MWIRTFLCISLSLCFFFSSSLLFSSLLFLAFFFFLRLFRHHQWCERTNRKREVKVITCGCKWLFTIKRLFLSVHALNTFKRIKKEVTETEREWDEDNVRRGQIIRQGKRVAHCRRVEWGSRQGKKSKRMREQWHRGTISSLFHQVKCKCQLKCLFLSLFLSFKQFVCEKSHTNHGYSWSRSEIEKLKRSSKRRDWERELRRKFHV